MGLKNIVTCTKLVDRSQHQSVPPTTEKQVKNLFRKKAMVINPLYFNP